VTARVLIVDDEESIRTTLAEFIKEDRYVIDTAEDAAEALRLMDKYAFDVIVTDIVLPRMNGVALMKEIRKRSPDTQVIMLTGDPSVESAAEAVRAGAFDYITKPVSKDAIRRVVANAAQIKVLSDEKRELEESNRWYQNHLEELVEKRTKALQESEARYRATFESTGTAMMIIEVDTTLLMVNGEFEKLCGYSREEIEGKKSWTEFVAKEDLERMKTYHDVRRTEGGNAPSSYEFRLLARDGGIKNIFLTVGMIPGTKRSIASLSDITKLKQAEEAARESEARYRGIVQYQTECIDRWLPDGTVTFVNDAYCRYYGKTRDELIGAKWKDVVVEEEREHMPEYAERLKATLTPEQPIVTNERREVAADGEIRWMQWSDQALFDEQGDLVEFQSVGRDITQRKLAEEALRREQSLTLTLSRATAAIASVLSLDEVIEQILAELEEIVVADAVNIMLVDSGVARIARARVCAGSTVDLRVVMDQTFSVEETPNLRRMVETRQPVVIEDVRSCQDWITLPGEEWLVSYTGVPIVTHNEVIGILNAKRTRMGSSNEKEIERLKIFASMAAVGIENARLHEGLRKTLEDTIRVVGLTTEMRDPYTARHQERVTELACAIAREMSIPEGQIEGIHAAGLMHDIGKISIPAEILTKPAKLTDLEFGLIKTHPQVAYDILKGIEFPWPVADIVLQHHEWLDGSGYPNGLKGDEIMLEARILTVADVVEAMSSHRPYRPARGLDKALEEIKENAGKLYDPKIVDACLKLFANGIFKFAD